MDKIIIKDLLAHGIIGIYEREREKAQNILINLTLYTDLTDAGKSDNYEDSINYAAVADRVKKHAETAQRLTVEALAQDIVDICLKDFGAAKVTVRVEKPSAIGYTQSVGIEMERSR
ncbi:MAG: dihydroneopterin aldolase [Chloroflexi bacterium]|nr:MAG: dihydroneopterin aldolase [Chloroflexota bacterium]MBL1195544.1 dihydroneopterin aldolase [Chloroflexota bacterium]NOH12827.1 dihydroneopterin aldolase [Chloroflexota bacterium]